MQYLNEKLCVSFAANGNSEPDFLKRRVEQSMLRDLVSFPGLWVCRADVRASLDEGRHGWLLACQCRRFQIWMPYPSTS
jgi:hypothetical protein